MRRSVLSHFLLAWVFVLALSSPVSLRAENILEIVNQTSSEILNILAEPLDKKAEAVFLRLDLEPGLTDKITNPGFVANLRVDNGLQFWFFRDIQLPQVQKLEFCSGHACCLAITDTTGQTAHVNGAVTPLVPGKGSKPVCELDSFRPLMPMREVCAILPPDVPRDDNGACLTGLGFAGLLWAARLVPFHDGPITENTRLENLELRNSLTEENLQKVLAWLFKKGYVPWQAEFPGLDLDFSSLKKNDSASREERLQEAIHSYLAAWAPKPAAAQATKHTKRDGEATIMLAPANNLQALENADNPDEDVQLFTLILKPISSTMLVDISAYLGKEEQSEKDQSPMPGSGI